MWSVPECVTKLGDIERERTCPSLLPSQDVLCTVTGRPLVFCMVHRMLFNFLNLFLAALGHSAVHGLFSGCDEQGLLASCCMWASQGWFLLLWYMGLITSQYMGSSPNRGGIHVPYIGREILNHWTNTEVLRVALDKPFTLFLCLLNAKAHTRWAYSMNKASRLSLPLELMV